MIDCAVRVHKSSDPLPREEELAWRLAALASDPVAVDDDVAGMAANRVIDNAGVAAAALLYQPVVTARRQALCYPSAHGGTVFGLHPEERFAPEWANSVAVRELDFHDTFLAREFSHPGDSISALVAVAQHRGLGGSDLVRAIATSYEVQIDLARAISLHVHKIDHVAHLGPAIAAGLGTLLHHPTEVIYQAIQQTLHTTTSTRQVRKGQISSWKAFAPAFVAKVAIEAIDRAMRGETSPSPIYEGEDGIIAWMLDGSEAEYVVSLPEPNEPKRALLESYTKEHAAAYHAQALIDLARRIRLRVAEIGSIEEVVIQTNEYSHSVIGTGANDPQKMDPDASRETLDHSSMYIFAVALEDAAWHHENSYSFERSHRPETLAIWRKVRTVEDPEWTRWFLASDRPGNAFGGRVVITLRDGSMVTDEIAVADAHPLGATPFDRNQYIGKFVRLAEPFVAEEEQRRFLEAAQQLEVLPPGTLTDLTFVVDPSILGSVGEQRSGLLG